jgi:flagellar hook protein FlgE
MGLYGMMRTSVSGMAAQANRLSAISDNVANAATPGYKDATISFSTLVLQGGGQEYASGNVESQTRRNVAQQGAMAYTTSATDLAIKGDGFFVVQGENGQTFLTRAGSFQRDGTGNLVNAAGFKLMGYDASSGASNGVSNGTAGLTAVNFGGFASLQANATDAGKMYVNFPSTSDVIAGGDLPSTNSATSQYTGKSSLVVYDSLGNQVTLDIYSSKTGTGTWEVSVYNRADADPTSGSFPYANSALNTQALDFDSMGQFTSGSATSLSIAVPSGATMTLDLSQSTQLSSPYTVFSATANGNAPSEVDHIDIDDSGEIYAIFKNGERILAYKIPLAKVPSPNNLTPATGNVYSISSTSGELLVGTPNVGGFGSLVSGALEQSTVDLGAELTSMIESQRNYTANSKVFQTGSELIDVLVNLKR